MLPSFKCLLHAIILDQPKKTSYIGTYSISSTDYFVAAFRNASVAFMFVYGHEIYYAFTTAV